MSRVRRSAFTLIELLVVITVIGMLMGILIPAINAFKELARTAACRNNLRTLGQATLARVNTTEKQRFPGYRNLIQRPSDPVSPPVGWGVVLLPQLQQGQLFDRIQRFADRSATVQPYLEVFVCPSNPPENNLHATSAYVANCGKPDSLGPDSIANGIFFDHSGKNKIVFTAANLVDGESNTLMYTENVNCDSWSAGFGSNKGPSEAQVGFCWWDSDRQGTSLLPIRKINGLKSPAPNSGAPPASSDDWARPSSNHSGGVNVCFADGHQTWLREDIAYHVYQQLLTPDGANATPVAADPATGKPYLLNRGDY